MTKTVRAHTNIALIKYWGKKDRNLKIPYNPSLSLTLDKFYTDTKVTYDKDLNEDVFILDGIQIEGKEKNRVVNFMNWIREAYNLPYFAVIDSTNHVPKAAGLASSASAFAALAKAATLDLNLSDEEVSRVARVGSGSACRSIYGGFVEWLEGVDHESSYAIPVEMTAWDSFRMVVCILNDHEKQFLSSEAMEETVVKSPYYASWVETTKLDNARLKEALISHDIWKLGLIAQENSLKMHASLMAINKWYFEPKTLEIMNRVRSMQKDIPVFFTMDAGPNVKIMTTEEYLEPLLKNLEDIETIVCKAGMGLAVYD